RKYVNLFRGMLHHAPGGEGFTLRSRFDAGGLKLALVCAWGRGRYTTVDYGVFEQSILSQLVELDPADVLRKGTAAADPASVLRAELAVVRGQISALRADV